MERADHTPQSSALVDGLDCEERLFGWRAQITHEGQNKYLGSFDQIKKLEEEGKLDPLLNMKGQKLLSESEHKARLKKMSASGN